MSDPVNTPAPGPDLHPLEAAQRQRAMIIRLLRMAFFVLLLTVTLLAIVRVLDTPGSRLGLVARWYIPLTAALLLFAIVLAVDFLTPRKKISMISGVFFGLIVGMAATVATGFVIDLLAELWGFAGSPEIVGTCKILIGIALCYLGISTVLQTQDDFRLVIPYVEFSRQMRGVRPLLLDTSALIDARVVDLAATGIIQFPIVIPRAVIAELQALADSQDRLKRARGRRGLEVIARLQRSPGLDVSIDEAPTTGVGVDQILVELARRMPATIVSTDVALNRIAAIQGVTVLNLNDVANALKPTVIPGEQLTLTLLKPGEQPGQGVGYLEDGTMVVAEDGGPQVGRRVTLTVTSALQTSAGRLIFGRLASEAAAPPPAPAPTADGAPPSSPAAVGTPPSAPAGTGEAAGEGSGPARDAAPDGPLDPGRARGPFPPKKPARPNPARNPRR